MNIEYKELGRTEERKIFTLGLACLNPICIIGIVVIIRKNVQN